MKNRKKYVIGIAVAVLAVGAGIAYAAWLIGGSGTGSAKAATAQNITLAAPASVTGDLYPGFTGGDLAFEVTNPNNFPVSVTGLTVGTITSDAGAACAASNIAINGVASGLSISVPANASAAAVTVPDVVSMIADAAPGCQGATFTVAITGITAASAA